MDINDININNGFKMIEASAGTGKTFAISHLALRNIVERKLKPEELLIISYTKKSANDLKEKIIERFSLLRSFILKEITDLNIDKTLKEWYENLDANSHILPITDEIIDNPQLLNITTIDGFFKNIFDEYAVEFQYSSKINIENNLDNLYKNIIEELWIKDFLTLDLNILKSINERSIKSSKNFGKRINKKLLTELLKKIDSDNLYKFKTKLNNFENRNISKYLKDYLERYWKEFYISWTKDGKELHQNLINIGRKLEEEGYVNKIYKSKNRKFKKNNNLIENINKISKVNFSEVIYEITKEDDLSNYYYSSNIIENLDKYNSYYNLERFKKLQKNIYHIKFGFFNEFIKILLSKAVSLTSLKKKESNLLKSSDISSLINSKFNNNKNLKQENELKISRKYKAIFIDEFQDTDKCQWEIIKYLFKDNNHLLITVGDPKQAIYKFRGGDINTYIDSKKEADEIYFLNDNYRSIDKLINIINNLYKDGLNYSNLEYYPLNAKVFNKDPSIDDKKTFNLLNYKGSIDNVESHVIKILLDVINQSDTELNKIAILTRTNKQCEIYKNQLKDYGIPYQLINKKNIFDTEAANLIETFINYLEKPNSSKNLLLLATSKFIELDFDELKCIVSEKSILNLSKKLNPIVSNIQRVGFISSLFDLLNLFKSNSIMNDNNLLNDLFQLSEIIEIELIKNNYNFKYIKYWLCNELDSSTRININENFNTKDNQDNKGININTIHSSKGLEFDIVICPYLWMQSENYKGPLWKNIKEKEYLLEIDYLSDEVSSIYESNKKEEIKENERLIYVALTRAKYKLFILNNLDQIDNNLLSSLLIKLKNKRDYIYSNNLGNKNLMKFKSDKISSINETFINFQEFSKTKEIYFNKKEINFDYISSYTSWTRKSESKFNSINQKRDYEDSTFEKNEDLPPKLSTIVDKSNETNPLRNFPRGLKAGICLHNIIEKYNFKTDCKNKLNELIIKELNSFNFDKNLAPNVTEGIQRIINTPLGLDSNNSRLIDIPEEKIIKELKYQLSLSPKGKIITTNEIEKCFLIDKDYEFGDNYIDKIKTLDISSKGFHNGSIDCIIPIGESIKKSKWWIIDWKSNVISKSHKNECHTKNYSYENMKEEMIKHHYPLQSHLYLLALHRYLNWRLPNYNPKKSLGGYLYIFMRGIEDPKEIHNEKKFKTGLFSCKAPISRILYLDNLFKNEL